MKKGILPLGIVAVFVTVLGFVSVAASLQAQAGAFGKTCLPNEKGIVPDGREPIEDGSTTVICDGVKWQALASVKSDPLRQGIGTADPQATLDVNGGVKIGNDTGDCTEAKAGTIRFNEGSFDGCNGKAWVALQAAKGR